MGERKQRKMMKMWAAIICPISVPANSRTLARNHKSKGRDTLKKRFKSSVFQETGHQV